jgi:signal transduction histidine kinase/DNA-binding response OmpR family regulator/ligand-binding sensor domain-containing protein
MIHILFLSLIFQTASINIPSEDYSIQRYSLPKTYNSSQLFDLVRDHDGFIYLATATGLIEWDGRHFTSYNSANTPSMISDRIRYMYVTQNNDLWLFRSNHYITRKRGDQFTTFTVPAVTGPVRHHVMDQDENPWVLTDNMIYTFDQAQQNFLPYDRQEEMGTPYMLSFDVNGTLTFVTDSGIWEYAQGNLSMVVPARSIPVELKRTVTLYRSKDHLIYLGHDDGFLVYDPKTAQININYTEKELRVFRFAEFNPDEIIAFSNRGTAYINSTNSRTRFAPSVNDARFNIYSNRDNSLVAYIAGETIFFNDGSKITEIDRPHFVYIDNENHIWVASLQGTIHQIRKKSVTNVINTEVGQIENVYSVLQESDDTIWFSCISNGIYRSNASGISRWHRANSNLPANTIRYLYKDPYDDNIYASMYHNGLWRFERNDWVEVTELHNIYDVKGNVIEAMYRDPLKNRLLVGSGTHMAIKDESGWSIFEPNGANSPSRVRVIRTTSRGELILGSDGHGIKLLDSNDRLVWSITMDQGLASNYIRDVYVQSADTFWVATENNGVNRLILGANRNVIDFKQLGIKDGLSNLGIHRIIPDSSGYLWISSNFGIMAAKIQQLNDYLDKKIDYLPIHYTDDVAGMLNPEANGGVDNAGIMLNNGILAFPTQQGVVMINPDEITKTRTNRHPKPSIRHIRTADETFGTFGKSNITLPLGVREFVAFFQVPVFNDPDYRIIRYKLNGVDRDWRVFQDNLEERYTGMKPGKYELIVQLVVPDGVPEQTSIRITVPHFLYERTWFQIVAFLSLVLTVVYGTRFGYDKKLEMDEIRRLVELQTTELTNLNLEKSRFFAGITHELKTPVSIIMGNIDRLLTDHSGKQSSESIKPLKTVQRNSYKLLMLIDTLLGIAKLQDSRVTFNSNPIHAVRSTHLILEEMADLFREKKIRVKWTTTGDLDHIIVLMDPAVWERIIVNILVNAINYSPANSTVYVDLKLDDQFIVEVTDEGPGVDIEDIPHIFDYFKQGDVHKHTGGSGLGLYLAHELVSRHQGSLTVFNKFEEQKGACFQIKLPYTIDHTQIKSERSHEMAVIPLSTVETISDSPARLVTSKPAFAHQPVIMIVDDNSDYREYLISELSSSFNIVACESARKALEMIETTRPEVVISDVMMPEMSGFELVASIRKIDYCKKVPVIFLSALDSPSDTHTGLSAGADVYLSKPVKPQVLKAQIQALLRREKKMDSFATQPIKTDSELVTMVKEIIYRHMGNKNLSIDMISESLFISRATLYRKWGEENDSSLQNYILHVRLTEAHSLIRDRKYTVSDAALSVGFSSARYFSTAFKKEFGYSPSELLTS